MIKTLIIGLLAAVGLVNTTDVHNAKELSMPDVPPMIYPGEYVPLKLAYYGPRLYNPQKVATVKKKSKK